jgi:hypothetical protein
VLSRLGFDAFLDAHPRAWELELGREILFGVAERAGVPVDDPVLAPLWLGADVASALAEDAAAASLSFDLGDAIRAGLARAPLYEAARVGDESARVLADATDFVLALGRPSLPEPGAARVEPLGRESDFTTLREAWVTAVERWLGRYTELDSTALVARAARVVVTSTHVDLFFTHRDADVRIRRPALDLDPGWVHWLGRVIAFHYVEELDS